MTEKRVQAGAREVVIHDFVLSVVRSAELTGEKGLAILVRLLTLAGIVVHCPMPLLEKTIVVAAGAWRSAR